MCKSQVFYNYHSECWRWVSSTTFHSKQANSVGMQGGQGSHFHVYVVHLVMSFLLLEKKCACGNQTLTSRLHRYDFTDDITGFCIYVRHKWREKQVAGISFSLESCVWILLMLLHLLLLAVAISPCSRFCHQATKYSRQWSPCITTSHGTFLLICTLGSVLLISRAQLLVIEDSLHNHCAPLIDITWKQALQAI